MELSDYVSKVAAACRSAINSPDGTDLLTGNRTNRVDGKLTTQNKPLGLVRLVVHPTLWVDLEPAIAHLVKRWCGPLPSQDGLLRVEFEPNAEAISERGK